MRLPSTWSNTRQAAWWTAHPALATIMLAFLVAIVIALVIMSRSARKNRQVSGRGTEAGPQSMDSDG